MTEMGPNSANDRFFCTMILTLNKKSIVMRFSPRFKGFLEAKVKVFSKVKVIMRKTQFEAPAGSHRENGCGHTFSMTSVNLGRYVTCLDFIYR